MNNDPCAAGREGGRDHTLALALALASLSADILDISGSSFRDFFSGGRGTHSGGVRGFLRRVLERVMNASGMLLECWIRLFLEAACSTRADVAPREITGSSFCCYLLRFPNTHRHTPSHRLTHSSGTFSAVRPSRGEHLRGEFNPQLWRGGYLQPSQMVLFTFYKDLCLRV